MPGDFRADELRDALRGAGTDIWEWDLDSDALSASDKGFERLGYAPGEFPQTQAAWAALMHPEDRWRHDTTFARYRRGEAAIWDCVYRIRARDGQWRHFEERGRFVAWHPDGRPARMLGTQTDVSERERLRDEAGRVARQLEALARQAPGVLFQFRREADGRAWFPYASERCRDVTGLEADALREDAATMLRAMQPAERGPMLDSIAESARTLRPWRLQFALRRGAETALLRGTASPRREADGATLWHGYLEDATELAALEQLQREKLAAEAASRAKSDLLTRISHELRTPLNAVLGFTQLLENDPSDPPSPGQRQRLALVHESGRHLLHMITDLLDLSRAEAGQVALQVAPVALAALVHDCAAMVGPSAARAGVVVSVQADPALVVPADPARLRQVLLNLLDNAVKYNRRGGWLKVAAHAQAGVAQVEVADNGHGIAADELPLLFDPFWRSPSLRGAGEGSGIGLAVTRSLVHAMGGRITVDSRLGEGSVFRVALPLQGGSLQSGACTPTS